MSGVQRKTSSFYWTHLSTFHLKTETESSLQNIMFLIIDKTMDNVQNYVSYILIYHHHKPMNFIYENLFKCFPVFVCGQTHRQTCRS
jgi:hypothetical protein